MARTAKLESMPMVTWLSRPSRPMIPAVSPLVVTSVCTRVATRLASAICRLPCSMHAATVRLIVAVVTLTTPAQPENAL